MRSLRNTHSLWWTPPEVWDGFAGSLAQTKQGEVYLLGPQTDADPRDELWRTRDHMNLQDVPGTADGMRTLVGYARAIVGNYPPAPRPGPRRIGRDEAYLPRISDVSLFTYLLSRRVCKKCCVE